MSGKIFILELCSKMILTLKVRYLKYESMHEVGFFHVGKRL